MSSVEKSGLRERKPVAAALHTEDSSEKKQSGSAEADALLEPDYVLVFSKDNVKDIQNAIKTLKDAGFFVLTRPGEPAVTLLLIRAGPGLVAGSANRLFNVRHRLAQLSLSGVTDKFSPYNWNNKGLQVLRKEIRKYPMDDASVNSIEAVMGPDTAAAIQFEMYAVFMVLLSAVQLLLSVPRRYSLVIQVVMAALYPFVERRKSINRASPTYATTGESHRPGYKGTSPVKREAIRLLFIPFVLTLMIVYTAGLLAILALEIFCTQIYNGPVKPIVGMVPVGANVVASKIYAIIYGYFIDKFTDWEDYPSERELKEVKYQRQFYLEALLGYLPILLTAYLYLPYGHLLINVVTELHRSTVAEYVALEPKFTLNKARLLSQARFYGLIQPIVLLAMETLAPVLISKGKRKFISKKASLNKFDEERQLPQFDSDREIMRSILFLGYTAMLTPIWPYAAVAIAIVLVVRFHVLKYLLTTSAIRRPEPTRSQRTIGFWYNDLRFVVVFCSLVVPTIVIMYVSNKNDYYDAKTSFVSVPWLRVATSALVNENLALAIFYVATQFGESDGGKILIDRWMSMPQSKKSVSTNLPVLDEEQDALWSKLDK